MSGAAPALFWGFGLIALGAAAVDDLTERAIPNRVVAATVIGAVVFRLYFGGGPGLWLSLVSAAIVFVALALFASQQVIGGGDAKLTAAATLLVPPDRVGPLLVEIALAGGLLASLYWSVALVLKKEAPPPRGRRAGASLLQKEAERIRRGEPMPYAVATLTGVAYHFALAALQCASAPSCPV